jgi:leader peptidase (prepilin peptidase)/N-methyltransferase
MVLQILDFFHQNTWVFLLFVLFIGLSVGSFLNVVVYRLPKMMELSWHRECRELMGEESPPEEHPFNLNRPASHCPACNHKIKPWENIPLLSWLFLKGRCSNCGARISPRYPIVEALTAVFSLVVAHHFGVSWETVSALLLTWALIALSFIDYDVQLLPDSITLPFLWLGLFLSLFGLFTDAHSAIIGVLVGYLSLWSVFQIFKRLTGKEGMGYGDFKLLAMLGAWLGWQYVPQIVMLSALVGAIVGVSLILFRGRDKNIPIPFGPYLAAAGWISLIWGDSINHAYMTWSGLI